MNTIVFLDALTFNSLFMLNLILLMLSSLSRALQKYNGYNLIRTFKLSHHIETTSQIITQKPKCTIFNHNIINKKPCKPIDLQGFKKSELILLNYSSNDLLSEKYKDSLSSRSEPLITRPTPTSKPPISVPYAISAYSPSESFP